MEDIPSITPDVSEMSYISAYKGLVAAPQVGGVG